MAELLHEITSLETVASLVHYTTILALVLLVVLLLHWCGTLGFTDLKKFNVPGPKPLPFLGNFLEARKYGGLHLMHLDYFKKYGKVYTLCLGARPSLVVGDPELLKQIMIKDFPYFRNRFQFEPPPNTSFAKNVGALRDKKWKRIRNTLTPTFTAGKIKLMVPLIQKSCDTLVKKLEEICDTDQSVDMLDWFSKLTLEVILSTAFGVDAKIQLGENGDIVTETKKFFRTPQILRNITRLPFGYLVIKFLQALKGIDASYMEKVAQEVVKGRRQHGHTGRKDMLQLIMTAHEETTEEGIIKLTDDEIVAQSFVFLIAGYETSSNTLSFILYHLAVNPDLQDKLRAEIKEAIESDSGNKTLYDVCRELEYLDCVIKEALRLNPPAAFANRECAEDYDNNGIHIPAGTEIIIPIYALHHDPDAWEEPETFNPERFRGPANDTRHAFQHLPFGAGPRNCIGMRFALLEIKIALVKILMKFKFVRSPETQVPLIIHSGITLSAKDGVNVRVESLL
ncbi:cytochrome P450 3A8-like [Montipora capricornis]|uniref:cytochrome P450 3A8-like n=1 Tax=Montipora capricornis TaxID=246305 RepID=UPI0035F105FA